MCGIWFCMGPTPTRAFCDYKLLIKQLVARGPEEQRIADVSGVGIMGFTRLAINGLEPEGMQPMHTADREIVWMCNGEIYNWRELAERHDLAGLDTGSDCQVLGELYEKLGTGPAGPGPFFRALDGVFAIVIVDRRRQRVVVGRDPYGVRPLYMGQVTATNLATDGALRTVPTNLVWASEIKALSPLCDIVNAFPPGHYQTIPFSALSPNATSAFPLYTSLLPQRYHAIPTLKQPLFKPGTSERLELACAAVRAALEAAVEKRLMTERPVAALLSGGLDSSLIAALVQQKLLQAGRPPLRTFSIGMRGSTDLAYARRVADWIRSDHTEIELTEDDFFKAIPAVIQATETFDTTTIRASVGNWLVAKAVREQSDCKVVFNGDGSDEVWGSYLYFYKAPSDEEYEEEVTRLLTDIHYFDVLRSDRSISSHGLEPRTPFLDKEFVATARSVATEWRRPGTRPEKWLLRRAFDDGMTLPREVLWRRKEAFSDGVSSAEKSWYEVIQERVGELVPAGWEALAEKNYAWCKPQTAEQYYYRFMYEAHFGRAMAQVNVPYFWMPRWCPDATDPSARTLDVYGGEA